jgi:hypothetical protein
MATHSMAGYPTSFRGTVISPTKICMQFNSVELKLRLLAGKEYLKIPDGSRGMMVSHTGTPVDVLSVGCQLPTLEDLQAALVQAYLIYGTTHKQRYREEYGKEFIDFLEQTKNQITTVINSLKER